jgi:hypothetical protein
LAESFSPSNALPNVQTPSVAHSADPFGSNTAFNATYTAINTYTAAQANSTTSPNLSQPDPNQWKFKLTTTTASVGREEINWTIQVLGTAGVCSLCNRVIVRFVFFTPTGDTIDPGGNASYVIYRSTTAAPTLTRVFGTGTSENDTQTISNSTRTRSVASFCPDFNEVCYDATSSIGYNLTLAFKFGWNFPTGPSKMLSVQVGNLSLLAPYLVNANVHQMVLNPVTNKVLHTANVTSFNFNRTVTTPLPSPPGGNKNFNWTSFEVTLYYPTPYTGFTASNATGVLPAGTTGSCPATDCKSIFNSTFVSMSFSQLHANLQLTMTAQTTNTLRSISTVVGNLAESHWQPSESIGVKLNDTLAINQPGTVSLTQIHSSGKTIGPTQTQNTLGSGVFPIAAASSPLGNWNLNATFTSLYDYGSNSTGIFIEHLKLAQGFTYSGDNSRITATGTVDSESTSVGPAAAASVAIFGISTLTSGNYSRIFPAAAAGLYIHNITFVNGAFTSGRPLIMYLGIDNPSSTVMVGNLTISHEFISNQPHGVNATFSLDKPIDTPFQQKSRIYEVDVTFSNGLMSLRVTTLRTGAQTTVTSSAGSPPLFDTRQQFGLFNMTVTSQPQSGGQKTVNSRESQPFAYLFTNSLIAQGGRVLAAEIGTADSQGAFTLTTDPAPIPQARHLALIVLARDANGITLGNQDPTGATDSLVLCGPASGTCQPSLDGPTEATRGQSLTMTLRVRNNSTKLVMNLNITLQVFSGSTILSQTTQRTGAMLPGASYDFPFTFAAPSNLGVYSISFFSAQYGSPIIVTTLNVVLIPTALQIAIPVIIGVAVAVGLIIFFRIRKPAIAETSEKTKPTAQKTGPKPRNP